MMSKLLRCISVLVTFFLLLFTGFLLMTHRSCRPTWFEPAEVRILPIGLDTATGYIDTSGLYPVSARLGFALHMEPVYVAEAAIKPGILGLSDTLTQFFVETPDGHAGWKDVTEQFFYGQPENCTAPAGNAFFLRNHTVQWHSQWPDSTRTKVTIPEFARRFNGNWLSGLDVGYAAFTFWLKPGSDLAEKNSLHFRVRIETQKGKKWTQRLDISRVLSPSECREYLRKVTAGDAVTLLYDTCTARFRHFIFIDHNRNSTFYEPLLRFEIDEFDQDQYADFLKDQPASSAEIPAGLARQWVIVHTHKNRHYAYHPSDFGNHFRIQLNENGLIGFQMDGLELHRIKAINNLNDLAWELQPVSGDPIRLRRLGPKGQVWRWIFPGRECLMTPAEHLRDLPVIVNYCEEQKQLEFEFEQ